jgi:hypothetical protein
MIFYQLAVFIAGAAGKDTEDGADGVGIGAGQVVTNTSCPLAGIEPELQWHRQLRCSLRSRMEREKQQWGKTAAFQILHYISSAMLKQAQAAAAHHPYPVLSRGRKQGEA